MCLREVNRKLDKPVQKRFYKVMRVLRRKGQPTRYGFKMRRSCRPLEKGVVRHARNGWLTAYDGLTYRSGFHGYTTLNTAQAHVLRRNEAVVLCTGLVHTIGDQSGDDVCVASTMKILKESK